MKHAFASLGCLILACTCPAQQLAWTQIKPATSPSARYSHAMVYDSVRQRVVLFGGWSNLGFQADTWEWDGKNWTDVTPNSSPPARYMHAMAYDSSRKRTVLFGGGYGDTWEWDGKNWTEVKPATSPSARAEHAMAYDSARQRVVLFGGARGADLRDTWEWDGKNWTEVKPTTSPPGRLGHAMVYDSVGKRTVLFGGYGNGFLADTWEWDGKNWTDVTPNTSPAARSNHSMVYDSVRQRVVLFGGENDSWSRSRPADTWAWDGKNWSQIEPTTSPSARRRFGMAYDSARQRSVLFGGYERSKARLGDMWFLGKPTLTTDSPTVSITTGGAQNFTLDAGVGHGAQLYWIFGSVTGTMPGVTLASAIGSVHIPLNPDIWTDYTITLANTTTLANTKGSLDTSGGAQARLNIPRMTSPSAIGLVLYHAYLVYDANNGFHMGSNAVTLTLVK